MTITADRVLETSVSTGTGAVSLSGATVGCRTFGASFGLAASLWYAIELVGGAEWEVGIGHLSDAATLVRDVVLSSSNAGAAVAFSAGTKNVYATVPADALNRGVPVVSAVRYVAPAFGNDATAVVGDITKPYATVRAAVDAAVIGDTVQLLPGTHVGVAPLILKKNVTLKGSGRGSTTLTFDGTFPMQKVGATLPTQHGGQIQPATGESGVDCCYVDDMTVILGMNAVGEYAFITGVNTCAGTAIVGTGASYIDMRVHNCRLAGVADVHCSLDAKQRTYYTACSLETSYDFCHLIGPTNSAHLTLTACDLTYRPWYDLANSIGGAVDTYIRVRSGSCTINNCKIFHHSDGRTNWVSYGWNDAESAGIVVDHFAGAKIIVNGLEFYDLTPLAGYIRRFGSNAPAGTPSLGSLVITGSVKGALDYNKSSIIGHVSPPRIVPKGGTVLSADVFAGAASTTKNNTYRCSAAALVQTITLMTLPPGVAVKGVWIDRTTLFAGGASSAATVEVGIVGNTTKYLPATDIKSATGIVSGGVMQFIEGSGDVFTGAGTLVVLTLRTTGANVSTLTSGALGVFIELAGAPGV